MLLLISNSVFIAQFVAIYNKKQLITLDHLIKNTTIPMNAGNRAVLMFFWNPRIARGWLSKIQILILFLCCRFFCSFWFWFFNSFCCRFCCFNSARRPGFEWKRFFFSHVSQKSCNFAYIHAEAL